jgi:hypothetical protein
MNDECQQPFVNEPVPEKRVCAFDSTQRRKGAKAQRTTGKFKQKIHLYFTMLLEAIFAPLHLCAFAPFALK